MGGYRFLILLWVNSQSIHGKHGVDAIHRLSMTLEAVRLLCLAVNCIDQGYIIRIEVRDAHASLDATCCKALLAGETANAAEVVGEVAVICLDGLLHLAQIVQDYFKGIGGNEDLATL